MTPSDTLQLALISFDVAWEYPAANRAYLDAQFQSLPQSVDGVVLPEMFSTGFSMHPQAIAEPELGPTVQWMQAWSERLNAFVMGSVAVAAKGQFYNRLYVALPDGQLLQYDKRHLFAFAGEDKVYTAGKHRLVFDFRGFRICPLICYDLRFPVFARNTESFDVLVYVAQWPQVRTLAWNSLLQARAIENQCYVLGVNRIGVDAHGLSYQGDTQAIDMLGQPLLAPQQQAGTFIVALSKQARREVLERFPFYRDQDRFSLL